jgi:3-hydroxyacyl-CoA dehydrogenase
MHEIRNVTVVGAGTMGHSQALAFAQHGFNVWLNDVNDEILLKARDLIASSLKTLVEMDLLSRSRGEAALSRIRITSNLEEAAEHADYVTEAIVEDRQAKKSIFRALDESCPKHAILASNTSFLNLFEVVSTRRPEKVIMTHWFHPPHIIPLVEVVRGPETSQDTVDCVKGLLTKMGKKPIFITKFLPGFICNRLQSALRNEALYLLDNGYCTPEEIDIATKASFGLRTPLTGVVQRMDFAGLDVTQRVIRNADFKLAGQMTRSTTLDALVAQGKLGVKSGAGYYEYGGESPEEIMRDRDIKLLKLIRFLGEMGEL